MDESKLQEELANSVKLFNDFAERGIDFVYEQSPELCEQLINREFYSCLIPGIIFSVIFLISLVLFVIFLIKLKNDTRVLGEPTFPFFGSFLSFLSCAVTIFPSYIDLHNAFCIYIAPKVFLFEYFSRFI